MKEIIYFLQTNIFKSKKSFLHALLILIGIVLVLIFSGFGYTNFEMATKTKIILYIITFFYFFALFLLNQNTSLLKKIIRLKKLPTPSYFTISYLVMMLFALLSFLFNDAKSLNLNTYISFMLTISISYFILTTFDKKLILNVFKNTIFVLSVIGLVLFLYTFFTKTFFSPLYFSNEIKIIGNHLFFSNDYISGLTYSLHWEIRLSSVFWEPSVYGVMLIAALVADFFTKDKFTLCRVFMFVACIFLSQSTSAYILLFFVFAFYLSGILKGTPKIVFLLLFYVLLILLILFSDSIIVLLAKFLPNVFAKFLESASTLSFTTRLYSFSKYFQLFLQKPVFGFGGVSAGIEYYKIAGTLVDAETSTFGLSIASIGIGGLVYTLSILLGIVINKKLTFFSKIFIFLLVLLASNAQGQSSIIILNVLYLMPLSMIEKSPKALQRDALLFSTEISSNNKLKDMFLAKSDDGEVSRNIFGSLLLKGLSIILAFFTIPIYLNFFDNNNSIYGVWIAITSILSIITVFDFGMGNGLKNKIIQNISNHDDNLSKTYISTTDALTAMIGIGTFLVFSIVIFLLPDNVLIKIFFSSQSESNVNLLSFRIGVSIILLTIGVQFFLKNITYVLQAHQKSAISGLFMLITNSLLLIFASFFANLIPSSLKIISLACAYFVFLISPLLIANIYLYKTTYKNIAPSFKSIDFKKSKGVISSGLKFFIVQIGTLFLWSANEFIILLFFNYQTNLVAEYSIYYRLFSLVPIIIGTVIQQPIWTALSKADAENNRKQTIKYLILLIVVSFIGIGLNSALVFALPLVFNIWLGSAAPTISVSKQIIFLIYTIIYTTSVAYVIVSNAYTLFKSQIWMSILAIIIKIPLIALFIFVFKVDMGWELVVAINMICYLPVFLYGPFEIKQYLSKFKTNRKDFSSFDEINI